MDASLDAGLGVSLGLTTFTFLFPPSWASAFAMVCLAARPGSPALSS
jgi:hypothetical protein